MKTILAVVLALLSFSSCLGQEWVERLKKTTSAEEVDFLKGGFEFDLRDAKDAANKSGKLASLSPKVRDGYFRVYEERIAAAAKYAAFLRAGNKPEDFQWLTVDDAKRIIVHWERVLKQYRNAGIRPNQPNPIQELIVMWDGSGRTEYEFKSAKAKRDYILKGTDAIAKQKLLIKKIQATPEDSRR